MEILLNQSGSVTMCENNNAYLVTYKQPFEIQEGKQYISINGIIKEVVSKTISTHYSSTDKLDKNVYKNFLPNDWYDKDYLKSQLLHNRGEHSQNAKKLEFLEDTEVNGHKFLKGFTIVMDLEYQIDENSVYALCDKEGEDFYFLCAIKEVSQYFFITSEENKIYKVAKDTFFAKYSLYMGLYLQKSFL